MKATSMAPRMPHTGAARTCSTSIDITMELFYYCVKSFWGGTQLVSPQKSELPACAVSSITSRVAFSKSDILKKHGGSFTFGKTSIQPLRGCLFTAAIKRGTLLTICFCAQKEQGVPLPEEGAGGERCFQTLPDSGKVVRSQRGGHGRAPA